MSRTGGMLPFALLLSRPASIEYYEVLADVEGALEDEEHLTVLFLPTAPKNE